MNIVGVKSEMYRWILRQTFVTIVLIYSISLGFFSLLRGPARRISGTLHKSGGTSDLMYVRTSISKGLYSAQGKWIYIYKDKVGGGWGWRMSEESRTSHGRHPSTSSQRQTQHQRAPLVSKLFGWVRSYSITCTPPTFFHLLENLWLSYTPLLEQTKKKKSKK